MENKTHPLETNSIIASFQWGDKFGRVILYHPQDENDNFTYVVDVNQYTTAADPHEYYKCLYYQKFTNFDDAYKLLKFIEPKYKTAELEEEWRVENVAELRKLFDLDSEE